MGKKRGALRPVPRASDTPEWKTVLARAVDDANRMVPGIVSGVGPVPSLDPLASARNALAALKKKAADAMKAGGQTIFGPDVELARKAAGVIAEGAADAARFAGQVKDDIASDLHELASQAWSFASGPLFILFMLYLWHESSR